MASDFLVTGFRQAIQDLLVPEVRVLQEQIRQNTEAIEATNKRLDDHLRENAASFSALQQQIDTRFQAVDKRFQAVDKRFEALQKDMNNRFDGVHKEIMALAQSTAQNNGKLDMIIAMMGDVRDSIKLSSKVDAMEERLHRIEQRLGGNGSSR